MSITGRTTSWTLQELGRVRVELEEIATRSGASNLRVFGSIARGDASSGSDVDVLVDLEAGRSLFDLGGLVMDLAEFLDADVDVVTEAALAPRARRRVLADAVAL